MKNHSNWLGFDVKYWKRGLREDGRGLKQISHKKPFKKLFLGISWLGELRRFSRVASELRKSSRWTCNWGLMTGESRDESQKFSRVASKLRKTLTPVFQHRTCLNYEKQCKHKTWT